MSLASIIDIPADNSKNIIGHLLLLNCNYYCLIIYQMLYLQSRRWDVQLFLFISKDFADSQAGGCPGRHGAGQN